MLRVSLFLLTVLTTCEALASFGCWGPPPTYREEISAATAAVLLEPMGMTPVDRKLPQSSQDEDWAFLRVSRVLKGHAHVEQGDVLAMRVDDTQPIVGGGYFATLDDEGEWSYAHGQSVAACRYVAALSEQPANFDKASFFFRYWASEDRVIAVDAVQELGKLDRAAWKTVAATADRAMLWRIIRDNEGSSTQRRQALVLLGLQGDPIAEETAALRTYLRTPEARGKLPLDAVIDCYLMLQGDQGLSLVEELFLINRDAPHEDTYSTILALREHLTREVIARPRIVSALRLLLDRPELADLVIVDLARARDWTVIDRLIALFIIAGGEQECWVRVPIIFYVKACPLPEARRHLENLSAIDPGVVTRAEEFFALEPLPPDANGVE